MRAKRATDPREACACRDLANMFAPTIEQERERLRELEERERKVRRKRDALERRQDRGDHSEETRAAWWAAKDETERLGREASALWAKLHGG
jgi:hypothetical protein